MIASRQNPQGAQPGVSVGFIVESRHRDSPLRACRLLTS
jgi:hypothetical protein